MAGELDEGKGRLKEAAGAITDDDRLRAEGKVDRAKGKAKDVVEKAGEAVKKVFDRDRR